MVASRPVCILECAYYCMFRFIGQVTVYVILLTFQRRVGVECVLRCEDLCHCF